MITTFKIFEGYKKELKYKLDDYVLIPNPLPNSYTKITSIRNSSFADYMISTYNIITDDILEHFPVMENEIVRKLTPEEIEDIEIQRNTNKYNL